MPPILVDTSAVFAYMNKLEPAHEAVTRMFRQHDRDAKVVVVPVLLELFQLTASRLHYQRAITVYVKAQKAFIVEPLTEDDRTRMAAIMTQYADAEFDFADAAIMALAERLAIMQVATLDRRDFGIFRTASGSPLDLLPA